jgi:transcriptional regulator with XRE-family HTH domain
MNDQKKLSELSKRFLSILKKKDITAYKLSKEVPLLSQQKISNIKNGLNEPSRDVLTAILTKFPDINSDWLYSGTGNMFVDINIQDFKLHKNKPNILDTYSLEEIASFVIENEKLIKENCPIFNTYIQTIEKSAINNFLRSHLKKP